MSLTITIPGAVEATTGATAPATLTIGVGIPGAQGPAGPGVPAGGLSGQYLQKTSNTSYATDWVTLPSFATESWVTSQGYITSSALSPYLTTSAAASTYQTQAGMSSYLTSSTAASTYAPIAAGQPTSGTVGQVLTKNSGTNYDSSWTTIVPGDRYLSSSTTSLTISNGAKTLTVGTGLSYSSQQDIVIAYDAANHMHAVVTSYNSGTGVMVVDVQNKTGSGTYAAWTVNVGGTVPLQSVAWGEIVGTLGNQTDLSTALNAKLETSTAATTYAALSGATFTGEVSTPASTTSSAGFSIQPGVAPSAPQNGEVWNSGTELLARLSGVSETLARQSWVTSQGYLTSSALTPYAPLAGATFTGLVSTPAATTASAFLRVAHGAAPTTPVNGDIWTTTGGLFARINGTTQQFPALGITNTFTGTNTFSGASVSVGTSTAASTINIGSGATLTATTKAVNIGTAGVAGSTTNIAIGSATSTTTTTIEGTVTANGAALNLGTSTAAATYNLGTGATITATTKAVNIGTNGVAGSTTNIAIGSTTGTSTTTLQGTTNGVTAAQNTNTTALATTAFVLGQASSTTPVVDGTAAIGTATTFARADHVHPTDTSRAPLASPSLTGVPLSTTAAADTNTTQIATTAFVVGQASSTAPIIDGTATVGISLKYARADHVHPTDTSRAPLASPTFTGTPLSTTATVDTNTTQIATTAFVVGQGYAKLASPSLTGTPLAPTATAGTNTTQIATTAFVTAAVPAVASTTEARQFTSTTKVNSPKGDLWAIMSQDYIDIDRINFTYTTTGTPQWNQVGSITTNTRLNATAASSVIGRPFGISQIDQVSPFLFRDNWTSNINFNLKTHLSGRAGSFLLLTDSTFNQAFYFGKVEGDAIGDLTRRGYGWRWTGGTGSRFVNLVVHNGTTQTTVTSSFAVTQEIAFDWDLYSDGTGNVTLYINGSQVATSNAGPTSYQSAGTYAWWREETWTTAAPSYANCTSYFRGGRAAIINY